MYNLRAIQIFVVVAETRSFRKAAELVHRSQSAVSTQIKLLEDQIGVSLFHRTTRRVQLTAEGEKLLVHTKRALASLETGLRQIRESANLQQGDIAFGCVPSVAATILPGVLAEFHAQWPAIKIDLREIGTNELLDAVSRQDVQFGIGPRVDNANDFDFTPMMDEPIYALIPRSQWTTTKTSVSLAELARLRIVLATSSAVLRSAINQELAGRGLEIGDYLEVVQVQTMVAFAQAGLGTAILPRMMIPDPLDPGLQALPIVEPAMNRTICLVTLKGNALSPASLELVKLMTTRFGDRAAALV